MLCRKFLSSIDVRFLRMTKMYPLQGMSHTSKQQRGSSLLDMGVGAADGVADCRTWVLRTRACGRRCKHACILLAIRSSTSI